MYAQFWPRPSDYGIYLTQEDIDSLINGKILAGDLIYETEDDIHKLPMFLSVLPHEEFTTLEGHAESSKYERTDEKFDLVIDMHFMETQIIPMNNNNEDINCNLRYDSAQNKMEFYAGNGYSSHTFLISIKHKTENFNLWKERWKAYRERKK